MFESPTSRVDLTPVAFVEGPADSASAWSRFTGYCVTIWQRNRDHREASGVSRRLLDLEYAARSQYTPDALARIAMNGQEPAYYPLIEGRVHLAAAWLDDVFSETNEKTWELKFTPLPEFPPEVEQQILRAAVEESVRRAQESGVQDPSTLFSAVVSELKSRRWAAEQEALEVVERVMRDCLEEGNWRPAFSAFLRDLLIYDTAFIRGPEMRWVPVPKWTGRTVKVELREVPWFYCVNPLDLYPAPEAGNLDEGDLVEVVRFLPVEIERLKKVAGAREAAIEDLLDSPVIPARSVTAAEAAKAGLDGKGEGQMPVGPRIRDSGTPIVCLDIWTWMPARMLRDVGYSWAEGDGSVHVEILMTRDDNRVLLVREVKEPKRPYVSASWEPRPGSIWGRSLAGLLEPLQKVANVLNRAMAMNATLAGGAQIVIPDVTRLTSGSVPNEIAPMRVWAFSNPRMSTSPPLTIEQVELRAPEYLSTIAMVEAQADLVSGVYPPGRLQEGPMSGRSAAGASLALQHSGRVLRRVVAGIDERAVRPALQALYRLLRKTKDKRLPDLLADVEIAPKGVLALAVSDATLQDKLALLQIFASDTVAQALGGEAMAKLAYVVARTALGDQADGVLPPVDEVRRRAAMLDEAAQAEAAAAAQKAQVDAQLQMAKLQIAAQDSQVRAQVQQQMVALRLQDLQRRVAESQAKIQDRAARQQLAYLQQQLKAMEMAVRQQVEQDRLRLDAARLQLDAQRAQAELALEAQRLQAELALDAQKAQADFQLDAGRLALDSQEAAADHAIDQAKLQLEAARLQLEGEKTALEAQVQQSQLGLQAVQTNQEAALREAEMAVDLRKAEIQRETAVETARERAKQQRQAAKKSQSKG